MSLPSSVKVNKTDKFASIDLSSVVTAKPKREKSRLNKESGERIECSAGLIGGDFQITPNPPFIESRNQIFERLLKSNELRLSSLPEQDIIITLPNGETRSGIAFKTTPHSIAASISSGLADSVLIAKVSYSSKLEEDNIVACDEDESEIPQASAVTTEGELWDLSRPLVGNCTLQLLKYDDNELKTVSIHLYPLTC